MKHLLIALMCCFVVAGASAKSVIPKKAVYEVTKAVAKADIDKNEIKVSTTQIKETSFFRRQMAFLMTDMCGDSWIVYVSGPSSASNTDLWGEALSWTFNHSRHCM